MSNPKVQFVTLKQKTCNVQACPKVTCTSPQNATTSARDYFAILSMIQSLPMCVFLMLWVHVCVLKSLLEIFNYHPRLALLLVIRDASARSFITKFFKFSIQGAFPRLFHRSAFPRNFYIPKILRC